MTQARTRGGSHDEGVDLIYTAKVSGLVLLIAGCVVAPDQVRASLLRGWQVGWNTVTPAPLHYDLTSTETESEDAGTGSPDESIQADLTPEQRAFLETIAEMEGADYNTLYGGGTFTDMSQHPDQCIPIDAPGYEGKCSTAAGKYQFMADTWAELGLPDFSPASQEKAAVMLIEQRTDAFQLLEKGDVDGAFCAVGKIWASLPCNNYGQNPKSAATVKSAYEARLADEKTAHSLDLDIKLVNPTTSQEVKQSKQVEVHHVAFEGLTSEMATSTITLPDWLAGIDTSTMQQGDTFDGWVITSGYDLDRHVAGNAGVSGGHFAVDLVPEAKYSNAAGTPVYAAFDGTITVDDQGANGQFCRLTRDNITVIYGHVLCKKIGQVQEGGEIGTITTNSFGAPHLHLGIDIDNGDPLVLSIDPWRGIAERSIKPN